ncbi:ABC transporter [Phytophthora megakarya]|uniref:ABC transporter n=1 Tax=Phytophthora megakarya TaxID=4795 RepID=A0A225WH37_9STRA|nr:ABC transporter [Phytophthora megakarya]
MVGFSSVSAFFICTLTIALNMLLQGYLAELLVFLLPNAEVAEVIGVLVSLVSFLFAGFSPPSSELPAATKWLYHSMPLKYCLAAISAGVFGDCSSGSGMGYKVVTNAPPSLPVGITVKEYLELNFLMKHNEVWKNCGIVISFVLLLRVMALVAMRFCNYQKR